MCKCVASRILQITRITEIVAKIIKRLNIDLLSSGTIYLPVLETRAESSRDALGRNFESVSFEISIENNSLQSIFEKSSHSFRLRLIQIHMKIELFMKSIYDKSEFLDKYSNSSNLPNKAKKGTDLK